MISRGGLSVAERRRDRAPGGRRGSCIRSLRVAQKISQPGPGLGLGFRERGAGPAVALDLTLPPARSSAPADWPRTAAARSPMPRGWPRARARARRRRRGHSGSSTSTRASEARCRTWSRSSKTGRRMPSQVDQHHRAGQAGQEAVQVGPRPRLEPADRAGRAAAGAVACSSCPTAHARSPRRESKSGLSLSAEVRPRTRRPDLFRTKLIVSRNRLGLRGLTIGHIVHASRTRQSENRTVESF